jgi:hypothetical protein
MLLMLIVNEIKEIQSKKNKKLFGNENVVEFGTVSVHVVAITAVVIVGSGPQKKN